MLLERLNEMAFVAQSIEKYNALALRDQFALKVAAIFFIIIVLFVAVLSPVTEYQEQSQLQYQQNLALYDLIKENEQAYSSYSQSSVANGEQSLLGLANSSSKSFGISFNRYEPVDENALSLWIENARFSNLVRWLERLDKQYNIRVIEIDIDKRLETGVVDVRLELQG